MESQSDETRNLLNDKQAGDSETNESFSPPPRTSARSTSISFVVSVQLLMVVAVYLFTHFDNLKPVGGSLQSLWVAPDKVLPK